MTERVAPAAGQLAAVQLTFNVPKGLLRPGETVTAGLTPAYVIKLAPATDPEVVYFTGTANAIQGKSNNIAAIRVIFLVMIRLLGYALY